MATRTLSPHAAAAKAIRRDLKAAFPGHTFKVRASAFSNGDAVDIHWIDGPTTDEVEKIVGQYEHGHFDGMIDLYEYDNIRRDIPQVKYVMTERRASRAAFKAIIAQLNQRRGWNLVIHPEWTSVTGESDAPMENGGGYRSHEIWRTFAPLSLYCRACHTGTLPGDTYCAECGHITPQGEQERAEAEEYARWQAARATA